ncbi:MAG: type II toxin-antitoxin system HipA family toxin [Coriobacteriales bacterium]|jgi:serine/threonine-protein kinase HipA|nr:type II toxin-antitoxin system HipA family toxin [Coriobacteriales bacterium]
MNLYTYLQLDGNDVTVGTAYVNRRRGRLSSIFAFDAAYLAREEAYRFDPELELALGTWPVSRGLPASFEDSAPDRWGRNLIRKRLAGRSLDDLDYLLGVSDVTRQGALRFKTAVDEPFEHPDSRVPKLVALPKLMEAAQSVELADKDAADAVKYLLEAGSASLGGARPKAAVTDGDSLYLAKFPHVHDSYDVIGEEYQALCKAAALGLEVPEVRLVKISGASVLLSKRFDRAAGGRRVGYMSALTLLGVRNGETRDYLDIAEAIPAISADATADLHELFSRIAFTILLNNTDDHLRNHGFLHGADGWRLSPMFDVNPDHDLAKSRTTTIGGSSTQDASITALLDNHAAFRLTRAEAESEFSRLASAF